MRVEGSPFLTVEFVSSPFFVELNLSMLCLGS